MNTNPISLMNSTRTSSSSNKTSSSSAAGSSSESNMFMTLLVAQLKNQDPLQPQDGAAFVAQLAQFNSLDQLVGIRQSIEQLSTALHSGTTTNSGTAGSSATGTKPVLTPSK
jgi:flagellar basal-body rod modification protein FlgD